MKIRRPVAEIGTTGRKAEAKLAKRLGGRLTRASGNMNGDKGDLVFPEFLMETKATEADSYAIKHVLLAKIAREAFEKAKQPAFHVQFVNGSGHAKPLGSWVMIPEDLWEELQAMYKARD